MATTDSGGGGDGATTAYSYYYTYASTYPTYPVTGGGGGGGAPGEDQTSDFRLDPRLTDIIIIIFIFRNVLSSKKCIIIIFAEIEAAYFLGLMIDDEMCDILCCYFWRVSISDAQLVY